MALAVSPAARLLCRDRLRDPDLDDAPTARVRGVERPRELCQSAPPRPTTRSTQAPAVLRRCDRPDDPTRLHSRCRRRWTRSSRTTRYSRAQALRRDPTDPFPGRRGGRARHVHGGEDRGPGHSTTSTPHDLRDRRGRGSFGAILALRPGRFDIEYAADCTAHARAAGAPAGPAHREVTGWATGSGAPPPALEPRPTWWCPTDGGREP